MPSVYLSSKDSWVPCSIVKSNAKTYVVRFEDTEEREVKLKVKDGNHLIKKEKVKVEREITKKKHQVRL